MKMTSEESKEDSTTASSPVVKNGNPPMIHVSTDVLKEFMSSVDSKNATNNKVSSNFDNGTLSDFDLPELETPSKPLPPSQDPKKRAESNGISTPHLAEKEKKGVSGALSKSSNCPPVNSKPIKITTTSSAANVKTSGSSSNSASSVKGAKTRVNKDLHSLSKNSAEKSNETSSETSKVSSPRVPVPIDNDPSASSKETSSKSSASTEETLPEDDLLRPGTAMSGSSSLEAILLKDGENDDGQEMEDFSEENLLLETDLDKPEDENSLRSETGKEKDTLSEKSLHLFDDIGESCAKDDDASSSSTPVEQNKEIQNIINNLDKSETAKQSSSKAKTKSNYNKEKSSVNSRKERANSNNENSSSLSNNDKKKSNKGNSLNKSKSSDDVSKADSSIRSNDRSTNSLPGKITEKRSLPNEIKDNNSLKQLKKLSKEEKSREAADSSKSSLNKTSKTNVLTFSDALKSISVEEEFLGMDKPAALTLTQDVSVTDIPPSSLTVLQPLVTAKPKSSFNGVKENQGKKRPFSDSDESPKPDLKKIRVFKEEELKKQKEKDDAARKVVDGTQMDLAQISKSMELTKTMESRLQEEKALQQSQKDDQLDKDSLAYVDKEELERMTVNEMRKAASRHPKIRRIKRKELESLVIELFVDKVLYEHQLGQQKDLCKRLEATLEANRKKAAQFHKEVEDLRKVTQRLQAEHLARKSQVIAPVKVKRSVGIQATPTIIGKGLMHSSGNLRILSATPSATQVSQIQPGRLITAQPLQLSSQSGGSPGTQMLMVHPVVVQPPQNATAVGSPVVPVSGPRLVRTPLTPLSAGTLGSAPFPSPLPTGGAAATPLKPAASSFIDLTDEDDAKLSRTVASVASGSVLALQRPAGVPAGVKIGTKSSGQFVALNSPSSVGQLVLVPSSNGQPTTALVVTNASNTLAPLSNLPTGVNNAMRSTMIQQTSTPRFSSPATIVNATRVVVGTQMNGGATCLPQATRHPAPLPRAPPQQTSGYSKKLPPVPILKLSHRDGSKFFGVLVVAMKPPRVGRQSHAYARSVQPKNNV